MQLKNILYDATQLPITYIGHDSIIGVTWLIYEQLFTNESVISH